MPGGASGNAGIVVSLEEFRRLAPPTRSGVPFDRSRDGGHSFRIRAGAGMVAARVDEAAREVGAFLPPLPSSAPWCTVGGMVSANAAGARTFGYGDSSAWTVGLRGVDAEGRPFGTGSLIDDDFPPLSLPSALPERIREALATLPWPAVRKNASGYDLPRWAGRGGGMGRSSPPDPTPLLVGSEGTLVLITEVEWALVPLPESRGVALLPVGSPEELAELAVKMGAMNGGRVRTHPPEVPPPSAMDPGAVMVSACEFLGRRFLALSGLDDDPEWGPLARRSYALLFVEFSGPRPGVAEALHALASRVPGGKTAGTEAEARPLWALRHAASPTIAREAERGFVSTQFVEDSVVPPGRLADYIEGVDGILIEAGVDAVVFGHAGDGNVHLNPLLPVGVPDLELRVRSILRQVAELVRELGGTLTGEHGDGRVRAPHLETVWGGDRVALFRAVKGALDPAGILNPGVSRPLPEQDPLEGFAPRPRSWPV